MSDKTKTSTGRLGTEGLSQGLAEQANIQAEALHQDLEEVGTAYRDLKTGACATGPGLCAEHPESVSAKPQAATGKLQDKAKKATDASLETMRRWSTAVRNYQVEDLTQQVRQFARQHPALLIGGALLAGFALTRAIKISGNGGRHAEATPRPRSFEQTAGRDILPGEEEVFHS